MISDDDKAAFRAACRQVKPLKQTPHQQLDAPVTNKPLHQPQPPHSEEPPAFITLDLDHVGAEDKLFFAKQGIQRKMLNNLKRGRVPVVASLDLHGLTIDQAQAALHEFMQQAKRMSRRCVRVVHGKGRNDPSQSATLKNWVNHWLRQEAYVLAFCSCPSDQGGTGAVLVLLKKDRDYD